jgi:hypothetical protein
MFSMTLLTNYYLFPSLSVALVRKRTIPTERPRISAKLVPTLEDRGCRVVSATDPHGR